MRRVLIVFAREPDPATAKTRLTRLLSTRDRVAFYTAMLRDVAETARATGCDERILFWSATEQPTRLRVLFDGFALVPQSGDGLGERMAVALAHGSERGDAVVLIGSDAPLLISDDLDAAFRVLLESDVVFSPTFDGGFSIIGIRRTFAPRVRSLFEGVRWGAETVFETVARNFGAIRRDGDTLGLLPMSFDVDTPSDYGLLRAQITARDAAGLPAPRHLRACLNEPAANERVSPSERLRRQSTAGSQPRAPSRKRS